MGRDVGAIASEARGLLLERLDEVLDRHLSHLASGALRHELHGAVVAAFATIFAAASATSEDGDFAEDAVVF